MFTTLNFLWQTNELLSFIDSCVAIVCSWWCWTSCWLEQCTAHMVLPHRCHLSRQLGRFCDHNCLEILSVVPQSGNTTHKHTPACTKLIRNWYRYPTKKVENLLTTCKQSTHSWMQSSCFPACLESHLDHSGIVPAQIERGNNGWRSLSTVLHSTECGFERSAWLCERWSPTKDCTLQNVNAGLAASPELFVLWLILISICMFHLDIHYCSSSKNITKTKWEAVMIFSQKGVRPFGALLSMCLFNRRIASL